jgi:phenylacetate-coenzyme A ligase PaaK-like adenylate-forming protein
MDRDSIFSIENEADFEARALEVFKIQSAGCDVYKRYLSCLKKDPDTISQLSDIPFLPIEFFKSHRVVSNDQPEEQLFTSSGTTGSTTSSHYVTDIRYYQDSFRKGFERFYGPVSEYATIALLPSYLEREGSSLIYMVDDFINGSRHPESGYFLYNHQELQDTLLRLRDSGTPTLLIGVTYALLDFAETYQIDFPELIVMETGGMKGRRKEMIRQELHETLKACFGVEKIHAEYGMTELLSQAYSKGSGYFACPPWMKVLVRDINDPFSFVRGGQTGGINIIDLANVNSCSFLATQDLGRLSSEGLFEVLGRFDQSDARGCNLLIQ